MSAVLRVCVDVYVCVHQPRARQDAGRQGAGRIPSPEAHVLITHPPHPPRCVFVSRTLLKGENSTKRHEMIAKDSHKTTRHSQTACWSSLPAEVKSRLTSCTSFCIMFHLSAGDLYASLAGSKRAPMSTWRCRERPAAASTAARHGPRGGSRQSSRLSPTSAEIKNIPGVRAQYDRPCPPRSPRLRCRGSVCV